MSFKAMPPWSSAKTKVQLRISVQRLRILQEKKDAQAKSARRDIATLLEQRKIEKARVKVENIINEDIHVELLELLELCCELLLARFGLLEHNTREPDHGISEGVCSIIYAAPRTEIKELQTLRDILMHKYGREFSANVMENKDDCVNERVLKKTAYLTPSPQLVSAYLTEIAKGYSVEWTPPEEEKSDKAVSDDEEDMVLERLPTYPEDDVAKAKAKLHEDSVGNKDNLKLPDLPGLYNVSKPADLRTDNHRSKSPGESSGGSNTSAPSSKASEDTFDLLVKRFDALKRK